MAHELCHSNVPKSELVRFAKTTRIVARSLRPEMRGTQKSALLFQMLGRLGEALAHEKYRPESTRSDLIRFAKAPMRTGPEKSKFFIKKVVRRSCCLGCPCFCADNPLDKKL